MERHPLSEIPEADRRELLLTLALSFKEHARDQRHLCAEEVSHLAALYDGPLNLVSRGYAEEAQRLLTHTKAPGEE